MKSLAIVSWGFGAAVIAQFSPEAFAQATAVVAQANANSTETLESVIVTGTRQQGLKAVDSATPIQVIDAGTLKRTGQTDVMQALAAIIPSFTAEATGFDTANLTLSARLRGLSPNDALVLVNGKRRHTTANLHVDGGSPTSGAATADLSFIPLSLVDHVEVLLDGAAAQYGTDAIAGVVNIILKQSEGGSVELVGGHYDDEGGKTGSGAFNYGLKPTANSFFNVSLEQKYHGFSNRGAIDGRLTDPSVLNDPVNRRVVDFPDYPYSNRISGDAQFRTTLLGYNAGVDLSDALALYSFGTVAKREAQSFENYRLPNRIPAIYPLGFNPLEGLEEHDFGTTVGGKGMVAGWNYDLSATHGSDMERISTLTSGNASLNGQFVPVGQPNQYTPTNFYDGSFRTGQTTYNFDASHDFAIGLAGPLTVAAGVEYRTDRYAISPGDPLSYFGSGASSFSGYSPANSGSYRRNDKSGYIDLALTPIKGLLVDIAGRDEKYSDFGSAKVGKGTVRYDFTSAFAIRGTYSNGFRAPTLAEQFYSGNNVGPDSIYLQLPPNSQAAKAFNLPNLQPETSHNVSFGVVVKPIDAMVVTLDAYQILLKNRIVASGSFNGYLGGAGGVQNQAILNALTASGINPATYTFPDGSAGISFFTNGADTRTRGADLVVSYLTNLGSYGSVDWSLGGNYTDTVLRRVGQAPAILGGGDILDATASSVLTDATPKFRVALGGLWRYGPFTLSLRETVYGKSSYQLQGNDGNYYDNQLKAKGITDLELSYRLFKGWTIAAGAKNLLNTYPTKLSSTYLATYYNPSAGTYTNGNVSQYPQISPYGINGGYYYGRLTYAF